MVLSLRIILRFQWLTSRRSIALEASHLNDVKHTHNCLRDDEREGFFREGHMPVPADTILQVSIFDFSGGMV